MLRRFVEIAVSIAVAALVVAGLWIVGLWLLGAVVSLSNLMFGWH